MSRVVSFTRTLINELPYTSRDEERAEYRDFVRPGLVLRVGQASKTYYVFRRVKAQDGFSKEVKVRLGRVEDLTLGEARARAAAIIEGATEGASAAEVDQEVGRDEVLLTTREAAELTKASVAWYEKKRWEGAGPPYRKRGRLVRYVKSELMAWWLANRSS